MRGLGAFRLSVLSTVLVFVVIPAAFIGIVSALVLAGNDRGHKSRRYRPGRPYDFQPIWYLASPELVSAPPASPAPTSRALAGREQRQALAAGVVEDSAGERVLPGPTGGASDRW